MAPPWAVFLLWFTSIWIQETSGARWPGSFPCQPCKCSVVLQSPLIPNKRRLKVANCSSSSLGDIPTALPDNLDILDLSSNEIRNVSASVLDRYKYLVGLILDHNQLEQLDEESFPSASRLQLLSLTGNRFATIEAASMKNLLHMTTMIGLEADIIPRGAFDNLGNLRVVSLRTSGLVPEGLLVGVSVYSLTLNLDLATGIPRDIFSISSKTLREFRITANRLASLPEDMLHNLTSLRTVSIEVDGMLAFPNEFFGSDATETGISYCYITDIFTSGVRYFTDNLFCDHPDLQKLTIQQTEHIADDAFTSLIRLHTLQLAYNNLTEINTTWFQKITGLKHLDLSWNNLAMISRKDWSELRALEILNVSNNNIGDVAEDAFETFSKTLIKLRLDNNFICTLPPWVFREMFSLEVLDLSHNCLDTLSSELFQDLWRLTRLSLESNRLTVIEPYTFDVLISLKFLNGSSNALARLEDNALHELSALQILDLSNNQISTIPFMLVSSDAGLKYVDLRQKSGTMFVCDCSLRPFLNTPSNWQMHTVIGTCSLPISLIGRELSSLQIHEVCAYEETTTWTPTTQQGDIFTSDPTTADVTNNVPTTERHQFTTEAEPQITSAEQDTEYYSTQKQAETMASDKQLSTDYKPGMTSKWTGKVSLNEMGPLPKGETRRLAKSSTPITTKLPMTDGKSTTQKPVKFRKFSGTQRGQEASGMGSLWAQKAAGGSRDPSITYTKGLLMVATICILSLALIGALFFIRRLRGHLYKRSYYVNYDVQ